MPIMKILEKLSGYMPSKTFALVFSAILVASLAIFTAVKITPRIAEEQKITEQQKAFIENVIRDTDNDGLKDWEEDLWKTDLNNPDTDSDGTKDGEEIKLNRNPALAGPNDEIKKEDLVSLAENTDYLDTNANQTELLARGIFSKYIEAKVKSGGVVPADTLEDIASVFSSDVFKDYNGSLATLTTKDISISNKNDGASIKIYANQMGSTINEFAEERMVLKDKFGEQELTEEQVDEAVAALAAQGELYQKTADKIKKVLTPSSYADIHLKILNSFNRMAIASTGTQTLNEDPATAIVNIKIAKDEFKNLGQGLAALAAKLDSDKITFNGTEKGSVIFAFNNDNQ